jgi:DNA-binding transcriptional regulator YiaG
MDKKKTVEYINTLLNQERERRNHKTDNELAKALGITSKTLSLWRNGISIPKSTLVLLSIIAKEGQTEEE